MTDVYQKSCYFAVKEYCGHEAVHRNGLDILVAHFIELLGLGSATIIYYYFISVNNEVICKTSIGVLATT